MQPENEAHEPVWTRAAARRARLVGVYRSVGAVLATLAFGLGWAGAERLLAGPGRSVFPRPAPMLERPMELSSPPAAEPAEPDIWLVDGFNVLHAGVLKGRDRAGWWTASVQLRLLARVAVFEPRDAELWVVFDAAKPASERCVPGPELARVNLVFAPSADDWLVRRVRQSEAPTQLAVVTGDRQVAGRARHAGARIISPRAFLARCPAPAEPVTPA
jgi:predicted RNA-binding protein with PIN domain